MVGQVVRTVGQFFLLSSLIEGRKKIMVRSSQLLIFILLYYQFPFSLKVSPLPYFSSRHFHFFYLGNDALHIHYVIHLYWWTNLIDLSSGWNSSRVSSAHRNFAIEEKTWFQTGKAILNVCLHRTLIRYAQGVPIDMVYIEQIVLLPYTFWYQMYVGQP